eukprot:g6874.t1
MWDATAFAFGTGKYAEARRKARRKRPAPPSPASARYAFGDSIPGGRNVDADGVFVPTHLLPPSLGLSRRILSRERARGREQPTRTSVVSVKEIDSPSNAPSSPGQPTNTASTSSEAELAQASAASPGATSSDLLRYLRNMDETKKESFLGDFFAKMPATLDDAPRPSFLTPLQSVSQSGSPKDARADFASVLPAGGSAAPAVVQGDPGNHRAVPASERQRGAAFAEALDRLAKADCAGAPHERDQHEPKNNTCAAPGALGLGGISHSRSDTGPTAEKSPSAKALDEEGSTNRHSPGSEEDLGAAMIRGLEEDPIGGRRIKVLDKKRRVYRAPVLTQLHCFALAVVTSCLSLATLIISLYVSSTAGS